MARSKKKRAEPPTDSMVAELRRRGCTYGDDLAELERLAVDGIATLERLDLGSRRANGKRGVSVRSW
jgi:hypothetical protein